MRMGTMAGAALLWSLAAGGPAQAGPERGPVDLATGQGSNYAAARAACSRQGKAVKLVGAQTTDKTLDSGGVVLTPVCVARPAVLKAKLKKKASKKK